MMTKIEEELGNILYKDLSNELYDLGKYSLNATIYSILQQILSKPLRRLIRPALKLNPSQKSITIMTN